MSKSKWRLFPKALVKAPMEPQRPNVIHTSAVFVLAGVFLTMVLAISTATAGNYGLQESAATCAANRFAAQLCGNSSTGRTIAPVNSQFPTSALKQRSLSVKRGIDEGNKVIAQSAGMSIGGAVYDPMRRIRKIIETTGGTVTSTKQFVWAGDQLCEERDASGNVTKRFFGLGEQIAGTGYYYTRDHNSSVHEMTNSAGAIQSQYGYGPWGEVSKLASGGPEATMQYAGMYKHERSGLNLAVNRAYSPSQGRFISRDPIDDPAFYMTPRAEEPDLSIILCH